MSDSDNSNPETTSAAQAEPGATTEPVDRFDLAGREIAALLRSSNEAAKRSQMEAERHSEAIREQARVETEAATAARLAEAEEQAEAIRAEATRHLQAAEQAKAEAIAWSDHVARSRTETTRRLDEVLANLDVAVEEIARLEAQAALTRVEVAAARESIVASHDAYQRAAANRLPEPPTSPALSHQPPATPVQPQQPPPANGRAAMPPPPRTTPAAPGVTEAVRSAVHRAVAERRANEERSGE